MRSVADIQADLDAARSARITALHAQSYSLDTGQGKQMVQRASLKEINATIRELESELEQAQACDAGVGGLVAGNFSRYGS